MSTPSARMSKASKGTRVRRAAPKPIKGVRRSRLPRIEFARVHLLRWVPRLRVVDMIVEKFGVGRSMAYQDIRMVWAEIHAAQKATVKDDAASLIAIIEEQIHDIRHDPEVGAAERARVIDMLVDRKAKLVGAYPERRREVVQAWAMLAKLGADAVKAEQARAATMTDTELQAAIDSEQKRLGVGVADDDLLALVKARFGAEAEQAVRATSPAVAAVAVRVVEVTESGGDGEDDDDLGDLGEMDEEGAIDVDGEEVA